MDEAHFPAAIDFAFERSYRAYWGRLGDMRELYYPATSRTGHMKFPWIGDIPGMRRWVGDKVYSELSRYSYQLETEEYYSGFSVRRRDIRRGNIQYVRPRMRDMMQDASNFRDILIVDAMKDGITGLAYDGQAFFANRTAAGAARHGFPLTGNDNLIAGTGVSPAQIRADIDTCRRTMSKFQTDTGRLLRMTPNIIICPLELEWVFLELLESPTKYQGEGANSQDNPNVVNVARRYVDRLVALPDLTDTNDWYYLLGRQSIRPFIYLTETLENGRDIRPSVDNSHVESNGQYGVSVEHSGVAGYGLPLGALKVVNA